MEIAGQSQNTPPLAPLAMAGNSVPAQRVGFGPRFGAILLDAVATFVLGIILGIFFGSVLGALLFGGGAALGMIGLALGSVLGMAAGVFVVGFCNFLLEMFSGASMGKLILGLKIASPEGSAAPLSKLVVRSCLKNIALIFFLLAILTHLAIVGQVGGLLALVIFFGALMMLGSSRQALHDKIAQTAVFHRRDVVGGTSSTQVLIVGVAVVLLFIGGAAIILFNTASSSTPAQPVPVIATTSSSESNPASAPPVEATQTVSSIPTSVPASTPKNTPAQPSQSPAKTVPAQTSAGFTISISPSSGPSNTKITISGDSFSSSQGYYIFFGNANGSAYGISGPGLNDELTFDAPDKLYPCSISAMMSNSPSCGLQLTQVAQLGAYQLIVKPRQTGASASNPATFTITAQ